MAARKRVRPGLIGAGIALLALLIAPHTADADDTATPPRVPRQSANLVPNSTVATVRQWALYGNAEYDGNSSRSQDGSGAFLLRASPIAPTRNKVISDFIPVNGGKMFTYAFYIKTAGGPTHVAAQISIHRSDKGFIRNLPGGRMSTSQDGEWQESVLPVFIPTEAAFVRLELMKAESPEAGGRVWVDDFYLGEGIGLQQPPSPKRAFSGTHVRVDALGNFEIRKSGAWTPFFPMCMYSDNFRDWSVYSRQGWNTIIWSSAASWIIKAKEATSEFNPDGMLSGFALAQYAFPSGWAYRQIDDLKSNLTQIFDRGLGDSLLLYYLDNENNHDQWKIPIDVINTVKTMDSDSSGKRRNPIYILQGEFNLARLHAAKGLADISGTYVDGHASPTGAANRGTDGLLVLDRLQGQVSPAAFAQFNGVVGSGDMRLRLYNAIISGAKAMGYWRDCYKGCEASDMKSVGPVDKQPWWPDFPNLRREVDRLLPLIRQPHWTQWSVKVAPSSGVNVGTRELGGDGYLILVNQTSTAQSVTLAIEGLPYATKMAQDYLDAEKVWPVREASLSLRLPAIGVASGTVVLHLKRLAE